MLLQINKYYSFSTENDLRDLNSFKNTCEQLLWRLYVTSQLLRCNGCMCASMVMSESGQIWTQIGLRDGP